ncbi:MAG TPA: four helix bundle protein [Terriglobales bacterium]|nr:four helix bundle protein [Terriglobales bacterium]
MQNFRNLKVWQKAHQLTLGVYRCTRCFPKEELYGLTSQMRRCSCSVASNIAEGCGRGGDADMGRFLQIAMGSASELEYQLLLSHDLGLVRESDHKVLASQATEVKRMLTSLLRKLKADS